MLIAPCFTGYLATELSHPFDELHFPLIYLISLSPHKLRLFASIRSSCGGTILFVILSYQPPQLEWITIINTVRLLATCLLLMLLDLVNYQRTAWASGVGEDIVVLDN